jgi:hypothetical protein
VEVLTAAGATLAFGGPIVHLVHGENRKAAISLGLRLGLPVLGGVLGYWSAGDCDLDCSDVHGVFEAAGGVILGTVAASLIDIIVVARTPRKRVETTSWAPLLNVSDSQVTAGVAGWF